MWKFFQKGFHQLSLFLSRGFYFYLEKLFVLLKKILPILFLDNIIHYFQRRKEDPSHLLFLITCFLIGLFLYDTLYVEENSFAHELIQSHFTVDDIKEAEIVQENSNILFQKELNYYRIYGKYSYQDISFRTLRETNSDVVAWISVDYTNINYPVVQALNNEYYLNHSIDKSFTTSGWIFMDYRNSLLEDNNTIFYGHNLLNKTAFGSLENIFQLNNKNITVKIITEDHIYTYQVFSGYLIDDEVYYLQNTFDNDLDYSSFLDVISKRNILAVDNTVSISDKIITLSTCTNDNKGRRVVHAKLMSKS